MAKFKTHKGLRKRAKVTARGKVVTRRPGKSHLNSTFPGTRIRNLRRPLVLSDGFAKRVLRALGED